MNKKRFFALSVAAATFGVIGMSSAAWAVPTSSHSVGAMRCRSGLSESTPSNPQVAYVTGKYTCPRGTGAPVRLGETGCGRPS